MQTVGEILKIEREKKGISLKDIEKKIRVREMYLRAVEEGNWSFFSSRVYITGIIKNYSRFLDLDTEKTLAIFRRDYEKKEPMKFKKRVASKYLTPQTRTFAIYSIIFIFAFFMFYFAYQLFLFIKPPTVNILSPKTYKFKKEEQIKIIGKTNKESTISIFGGRVYPNKEGIFEYEFPLKKGTNELVIEVVGANGKKTVFRKIYLREE